MGYHTGDLMFNGIHDKHRFLNKHLRTVAVTTPPPQYNLLYLHNNIAFTHLRQPIKTISNKEYMALIIGSAGWVYLVGANLAFAPTKEELSRAALPASLW